MNKTLFYIASCTLAVASLSSCKSLEDKLLSDKIYFDKPVQSVVIDMEENLAIDLKARATSELDKDVKMTYAICDESYVKAYNKKNGTAYIAFDPANISLSQASANIKKGAVAAEPVKVTVKNLNGMKYGEKVMIPIKVESDDLGIIDGNNIKYITIDKVKRIFDVWNCNGNSIRVPIQHTTDFSSVTYEALINIQNFGYAGNMTVMGLEGILIFRIGDVGGGTPKDNIQIAGQQQFNPSFQLKEKIWYHVAFTYDSATGEAIIYINGEKASSGNWGTGKKWDLANDDFGFVIGKVAGFKWGERPFYGYFSEVRVWNVARTANEIKNNMVVVDEETPGLVAYYHLNGTDQFQDGGKWYIKNASGYKVSNMDGICNHRGTQLNFTHLDSPVKIQ